VAGAPGDLVARGDAVPETLSAADKFLPLRGRTPFWFGLAEKRIGLDRDLYQRYKRRSENEEKADFAGFSTGTFWEPSASEGRAARTLDRIGTTDTVGPPDR